jgi:putative membrane protein
MSAEDYEDSDHHSSESTTMAAGERAREYATVYLKGMFMGAADAVPGVSGGTIALITGIYERLITAITSVDPRVLTLLPGLTSATGRDRLRERLIEMDVPFLLALGAGIITALVTVASLVEAAEAAAPGLLFAFFFGLIAASALVLRDEVSFATGGRIGAGLFGFGLAFVLAGEATGALPHTLPVLAVAGAIAICAMILPGISGAFILLLLGQYIFLSETLSTFVGSLLGLLGGGSLAAVLDPGMIVLTFGIGAIVGLFSISHAVRFALSRYRAATLTFLVALMVGALRFPIARVASEVSAWTVGRTAGIVGAAVLGAGLVLVVDYYTADLEY